MTRGTSTEEGGRSDGATDSWFGPPPPCSHDSGRPATACCTACGLAFGSSRLGAAEDGRAYCVDCAWEADIALPSRHRDPRCEPALRNGIVRGIEGILFRPAWLFAQPSPRRIGAALGLGLGCTTAGYAFWLGWLMLLNAEWVRQQLDDAGVDPGQGLWVAWLALPILAILRVFGGALALHAGCLLAGGSGISFNDSLRAFSLASAAMLLCVVPSVGAFLAILWWSWIVLAWMRSRFSFGLGRTMVALIPSVVVLPLLGPAATFG
ncbi:MAG: hypothetical protein EA398_09555 [Deltaproteobacteria bacterium]|nr:MAG: hypothetical protein EA398_09555 [Deltaproteobacteria bacterium]